jgi:transposase
MPKPYSIDLRARVIEEVETGASRREAAERYGITRCEIARHGRWIGLPEQNSGADEQVP